MHRWHCTAHCVCLHMKYCLTCKVPTMKTAPHMSRPPPPPPTIQVVVYYSCPSLPTSTLNLAILGLPLLKSTGPCTLHNCMQQVLTPTLSLADTRCLETPTSRPIRKANCQPATYSTSMMSSSTYLGSLGRVEHIDSHTQNPPGTQSTPTDRHETLAGTTMCSISTLP